MPKSPWYSSRPCLSAGLLFCLGLAACAPAAGNKPAPVPPAPAASAKALHPLQAADLPAELGGLARGQTRDFRSQDPGQGTSVTYVGPGREATVFLYDSGLRDLPEALNDPVVVEEFKRSLNEISVWVKAGWARDVRVLDSFVLEDSGRREFLCAGLEIDAKAGPKDSYLFLTSHQGQFVKVRVTGVAHKDSKPQAVAFALLVGRILWPAARQ